MSHYRKLIAAFVGLAVLFLARRYGVDLSGTEELLIEAILSLATLFGVWYARNSPRTEDEA